MSIPKSLVIVHAILTQEFISGILVNSIELVKDRKSDLDIPCLNPVNVQLHGSWVLLLEASKSAHLKHST